MDDKETLTPHGQDVFGTNRHCHCEICEFTRIAQRRLVGGLSRLPGFGLDEILAHRGEYLPLPMWGTLFIPRDPAAVQLIAPLLRPIEAASEPKTALASAGWQAVADTGVFGIECSGRLVLGMPVDA